jgi:hypothetical protein
MNTLKYRSLSKTTKNKSKLSCLAKEYKYERISRLQEI